MNKYFHGLLLGVSVLPALAIMPAMAYDVTAAANLNDIYPDGVITDGIIYDEDDDNSYDLSFTTPVINISNDAGHAVNAWWGSTLNFGGEQTTEINLSGSKRGLSVFDPDTHVTVTATDNVVISGANWQGIIANGSGVTVNVEAGNDVNISSDDGDGINVTNGAFVGIIAKNLTVSGMDAGILANYQKGQITIEATDDVNVNAQNSAIHAGFGTADVTKAKSDTSFLDITARNINLTAEETAIEAMSNGWIDLTGNLTANAKNAILARGYATVNVNQSGENTVKMNGDINFNFYSNPGSSGNSNSPIDAYVNVNLTDAQSYWTGNTLVEYYYAAEPADGVLDVNNFRLSLSNGAVWNATKITDSQTMVVDDETGLDICSGQYYVPLNNLNIDNGTVNIADITRGITVENANIKDATFNGGKLNIGAMTLSGGTNTFNNNVVGIDNASALTIANGATMNIGTNTVNVANINLDGTMLATLRDGDAQITAGTFDGNGTLKLSFAGEGTYHVFGDAAFRAAGIEATSSVYDITWAENNKDMVVSIKSAADIAEQNDIEQDAAKAIVGLNASTSEKLNDLGIKIQEKLAEGTPEAKHEVEHAAKAVHPEKESVTQSVVTSVQNTVTNLASARMAAPTFGRAGGDITMTSGGVWAQGLFNKSKQNDAFRGYTRGIAAGLDGTMNKVWTVGAGYSYAHSDISGSARYTEIDSNTVFLYGQYKPAAWYVNAVANYTMSDYSEEGDAMGTPVTADYDVDALGMAVAAGYDLDFGLTPELGLRYMHVMADDHTNSLGVKTKSDNTNFLTGVLGAKYAFNVVADKYTTFVPQLNAAIKYDMLSDKNVATITMPGVDAYTLDVERLSRFGGEFGIGLGMKHRGMDFSINYDIDVRKDYTSQTGMLKFRYNF